MSHTFVAAVTARARDAQVCIAKCTLHNPIFWVDMEMTGLDPSVDTILEVAIIVTDGSLETQIEGHSLCIHHEETVLASMNPWSATQHGASGLTNRCRDSNISLETADWMLECFIKRHVADGRMAVLGGACVYVDKQFIDMRMPRVAKLLSHRVIDVATVRQLAWMWQPTVMRSAHKGECTHRALDDIRHSIHELRYLRDVCWKPVETRKRRRA